MSWDDEGRRGRFSEDAYGDVLELLNFDDVSGRII
jgi:hypothetical protein